MMTKWLIFVCLIMVAPLFLSCTPDVGVQEDEETHQATPTGTVDEETHQATLTGTVHLNMKSYGNHNEDVYSDTLGWINYDERILAIRPEYVIDNPPHGLYGEMLEQQRHEGYTYEWLLQNVAEYQAAGIKVIGYISGGYEGGIGSGTPGDGYDPYWYELETNKMLIRNMAELDHVDGVFIDECSAWPSAESKAYLAELASYARSFGLIVWGNTGVNQFDDWYFTSGHFDFMQSSEDWRGQELSQVQQDWGHRISVTGFRSSYTAQEAYDLTIDAWEKGIAYCYINDAEYATIAPWFEEYIAMLRDYEQEHCPA